MSDLPAPPTPSDADLQDFPFMPLQVARLRDSDMANESHPEACWYAVLLWCASWHQLPAGSLPDNENVLTKLCGLGRDIKTFRKHRAEAMRGFYLCSDGRLYHPTVAEQVAASWEGKLQQRWRSECARIKKANQRNGLSAPMPTYEEFLAGTSPATGGARPENVPGDNSECPPGQPLQETGTGTGISKKEAIASSAASATPSATGGLFEAEVLAEPEQPKAKPDRWASDQEFAALWQGATDQMRRRSLAKAKLWPIWREAKAKAGGGVALVAAMARYRAGDPDVGRTGGPGIDRWLRDGVWEHWLGQAETQAPTTTWPGPPQLRAAIVAAAGEDVARGYLDPATWDGPARAVVVRNAFMAERLRREAGPTLDRLNVKITVAEGVAA